MAHARGPAIRSFITPWGFGLTLPIAVQTSFFASYPLFPPLIRHIVLPPPPPPPRPCPPAPPPVDMPEDIVECPSKACADGNMSATVGETPFRRQR